MSNTFLLLNGEERTASSFSAWKSVEEVFYPTEFKQWREETTLELLSESGSVKFFARLSFLKKEVFLDEQKRATVCHLENYLRRNEGRLGYYERLCSGRSIGSRQVEGACKNLVGRRLKQTGGRWCIANVNRMFSAVVILYTNQWEKCWNNEIAENLTTPQK